MPIPGPIADDGGSRFTGEVTGGTVTGPALNATVIGGTAYPFVKTDSSATFANNVISGRTNDGVPFLVQDNGVGPGRNQQFTWLNIEIGAPYTYLSGNFILAVLNRNADGTVITINAYLTTCPS